MARGPVGGIDQRHGDSLRKPARKCAVLTRHQSLDRAPIYEGTARIEQVGIAAAGLRVAEQRFEAVRSIGRSATCASP